MSGSARVLFLWESAEENSWNPDLARELRRAGHEVTEAHDFAAVKRLDLSRFDVCLPRFRVSAAQMACADELVDRAGVPMLNSRRTRMVCENKALAHLAFEEHQILQPRSLVVSAEGHPDRKPMWDGETLVKPLHGSRGAGIETFASVGEALARARERQEDLLLQQMIWPARSWRVIVGRNSGVVDPYWRRPPTDDDRILSISTGSTIARERSEPVERVAIQMLEAVDGDLLAVDVLETGRDAYALEINHNFDAHGGTQPAVDAFLMEIKGRLAQSAREPVVAA
jgi:glutathione synthase/RimK-type ligase-like ATP-grasp enzyme